MKKILFYFIYCGILAIALSPTALFAQHNCAGMPYSYTENMIDTLLNQTIIPVVSLPYVDNNAEKRISDSMKLCPTCEYGYIGKGIDASINIKNQGQQIKLKDSSTMWLLEISSPSAYALQFFFNKYNMPHGATLYLFNDNKTMKIGGFTSHYNQTDNKKKFPFSTQPIEGKNIIIEYREPPNPDFSGDVEISKISHYFVDIFYMLEQLPSNFNPRPGTSGGCEEDVACPPGDAYQDDEVNTSALVFCLDNNTGNVSGCSGNLLNNTNNDGTPYFLTAAHCFYECKPTPFYTYTDAQIYHFDTWGFLFNYQTSPCGGSPYVADETHYLSGAQLLAIAPDNTTDYSDYLLFELLEDPDPSWDITFAGWSREDSPLPPYTCIHHPSADVAKISTSNTNFTSIPQNFNNYWTVFFNDGIVERGSSGAALFDNNQFVIGQLKGVPDPPGLITCSDFDPSIGVYTVPALYGKFSQSWINGDFGQWLADPDALESEITSLSSYTPFHGSSGTGTSDNTECTAGVIYDDPDNYQVTLSIDGFYINGLPNTGLLEVCPNLITISAPPPDALKSTNCTVSNTILPVITSSFDVYGTSQIHAKSNIPNPDYVCSWNCWDNITIDPWRWSECSGYYFQLFISVTEYYADIVTPKGSEISGWVYLSPQTCDLRSIDLYDYLPIGATLNVNSYYKIKIAGGPWSHGGSSCDNYWWLGNQWDESSRFIHLYSGNCSLSNETLNNDLNCDEIVLNNVIVNNAINVTAKNSITVQPTSYLHAGVYKIDPTIGCAAGGALSKIDNKSTGNNEILGVATYKNNINKINTDSLKNRSNSIASAGKSASDFAIYVVSDNNSSDVQFNYTIKDNIDYLIEVYDLTGKKIYNNSLKAGANTLLIPSSNLSEGLYLFRVVSNNNQVKTGKFAIIK